MTGTPEEVFKAMNASNILVAILTQLKSIDIPTDVFVSANKEEKQLSVTYKEETNSFEFELRDDNKDDYELVND